MKTQVKQFSAVQKIIIFFLLLCVPLIVYVFQTQNFGDIRSKAGFLMTAPKIRDKIVPCKMLECPEGERKEIVLVKNSIDDESETMEDVYKVTRNNVETQYCQCQKNAAPRPGESMDSVISPGVNMKYKEYSDE
jgi:hypothetical protein